MKNNFIYFFNGSIGDILMSILLFDNVHKNNQKIKIYAVIPKNKKLFLDLKGERSHINILEVNIKNPLSLFGLVRFLFSKNNVLTSPTPGIFPMRTKIIAKLLSFRGKLVGFDDKYMSLYDEIIDFNHKILYYELLLKSLNNFGFKIFFDKPFLDSDKKEEKNRVIIEPFGSSMGRSFVGEELNWLFREVKNKFNGEILLVGGLENNSCGLNGLFDLSMKDLKDLINSSKYYIGVDTGPTHLACVLEKKCLIFGKNGTPNWLPFYNKNATILYSVNECKHNIYKGREHLNKCRGDKLRCLGDIPKHIIIKELDEFFK